MTDKFTNADHPISNLHNTTTDPEIKSVLVFWFVESTRKDWFQKNSDFDKKIHTQFYKLHKKVASKEKLFWREDAAGCMAEIIILDQFSRNMFRDSPDSFAFDSQARECLEHALSQKFDIDMTQQERNFLYLPLEHHENLESQQKAIKLLERNGDPITLDYAHRHQQVIMEFGRFPHRNAILNRPSSPKEIEYLSKPGSGF